MHVLILEARLHCQNAVDVIQELPCAPTASLLHLSCSDFFSTTQQPRRLHDRVIPECLLQMSDVLIAITTVAGHHPLNQSRLAALAGPLTQALASILPSLPPTASTSIAADNTLMMSNTMQPPDTHSGTANTGPREFGVTDESPPTDVRVEVHPDPQGPTGGQSQQAGRGWTQTQSRSVPSNTALDLDALDQAKKTSPVSALSSQLKPGRTPSALTAELGEVNGQRGIPTPIRTESDEAAAADSRDCALPKTAHHQISLDEPATGVSKPESSLGLELPHLPELPQRPEEARGQGLSRHLKSAHQEEESQRQEECRLARHFAFHVLMLLPGEVVQQRAAFWLAHLDGVPDLLHCCVRVATLEDSGVSLSSVWSSVLCILAMPCLHFGPSHN